MANHGACVPMAAPRIASIPQVGASNQLIGRTQNGSVAMGTSSPATSQIGYSSRLPSALACRYSTKVVAISMPSAPSDRTAAASEMGRISGYVAASGIPNSRTPQARVATMP